MSEPSPVSDPYAHIGIVKNPDGSITRDPTKFPYASATPDPTSPLLTPVVSKDITVNHSNSTWMRLYVPTAALNDGVSSKKLPLVVYYHGGGFVICSVDFKPFHDFCNRMARELNVVVASPSYRLAPEHRLPTAYEDGVDALKFIRNSDDEWIKSYADLSNVFLMGTSAGGNLAYNVGLRSAFAEDLSPLRIRGLILHHPFFGGEERCESEIRLKNDQVFPPNVADVCWELCLPVGANRDHEYSNPTVGDGPKQMDIIGRLGLKVMVSGGGLDPMIDMQRDVAKLMKEKGVDVVERFTDGDVHGAELGDPTKSETLFASIRNLIYSSAP
ncbi:carboxylesterase 120 [Hirschfeldia incana]|nr:carboxylesterase 120 [Hirschfeldia incana]